MRRMTALPCRTPGQTLHWPFEDPADATGTEAEQFEFFRKVRDQIQAKIAGYLASEEKK